MKSKPINGLVQDVIRTFTRFSETNELIDSASIKRCSTSLKTAVQWQIIHNQLVMDCDFLGGGSALSFSMPFANSF